MLLCCHPSLLPRLNTTRPLSWKRAREDLACVPRLRTKRHSSRCSRPSVITSTYDTRHWVTTQQRPERPSSQLARNWYAAASPGCAMSDDACESRASEHDPCPSHGSSSRPWRTVDACASDESGALSVRRRQDLTRGGICRTWCERSRMYVGMPQPAAGITREGICRTCRACVLLSVSRSKRRRK